MFYQYCDNFYDDILKDPHRYSVLLDEFKKSIGWRLSWYIEKHLKIKSKIDELGFSWSDKENFVKVELEFDDFVIDFLNRDSDSKKCIKQALKSIYRYEGEFIFEVYDIPF